VPVLVVHVRHMRMAVPHPGMAMRMRMGLAGRVFQRVLMLVMGVVHMSMGVLHRLMFVLVFVVLGQVQPDTHAHQQAGHDKLQRQRLA
jgi:hypothetical protein